MFNVPKDDLLFGKQGSTHPLSALLRDDATGKLLTNLSKLKIMDGRTLRLYNPTLRIVNSIVALNVYDSIEIYRGKLHGSDARRTNFKLSSVKAASSDVTLSLKNTIDIVQIFEVVQTPVDICFIDDIYHIDAYLAEAFLLQSPKSRVFALYQVLPLIAAQTNARILHHFIGAKILFDWTPGQYDHYTHFLEDGSSYDGSINTLQAWLPRPNVDNSSSPFQDYYAGPDEKLFVSGKTYIMRSSEPVNYMHHLLVLSNVRGFDAKARPIKNSCLSIWLPNSVCFKYSEQYAVITTQRAYVKFRNFVNTTMPNDLVLPKIKAYIRNDEELSVMQQEHQDLMCIVTAQDAKYSIDLFQGKFENSAWQLFKLPFQFAATVCTAVVYITTLGQRKVTCSRDAAYWVPQTFSEIKEKKHVHGKLAIAAEVVDSEVVEAELELDELVNVARNGPIQDQAGGMSQLLGLGEEVNKTPGSLLKYITLIQTQFKKLKDGSFVELYNKVESCINDTLKMSTLPKIDLLIEGLAGTGKTKQYMTTMLPSEIRDIMVICPTGDLVDDLQRNFKKYQFNYEPINPHLFQTYERSLKKYLNKHVILEEVYLMPSCFVTAFSFLRAAGLLKSLTVVGDFSQNLFDDNIVAGQDWGTVISLIQNASQRKLMLKESKRVPQIMAYALNKLIPNLGIVSTSEELGDIELVTNPEVTPALAICQANSSIPEMTRLGFEEVTNSVKAQGRTVKNAVYKPVNNFYSAGFYVALSRATHKTTVILPSSPSPEMQEKIEILKAIVSCRETWREMLQPTPEIVPEEEQTPEVLRPAVTPDNVFDLPPESKDDIAIEDDITNQEMTNQPALHKQKNKELVKRSLKASFKQNPELITTDVDLEEVFPEMLDFKFRMDEAIIGKYLDRYLTKLPSGNALQNQIKADVNEMMMSFKNQMKGGLTLRNKQNNKKVGQIVRASSKFYQITIGILINAFAEQVHDHLKYKGVFTGCAENDQAAANFLYNIKPSYGVVTYDTVKNESRVGPKTKDFERAFIDRFSGGLIPASLIASHDLGLYIIYNGVKIDCSFMRNSGEIATLFRNFLANYGTAKLRLVREHVKMIVKGDNVAIFSQSGRSYLIDRFKPLADDGTIELDPNPEWTNYKIVISNRRYRFVPMYALYAERFLAKMKLDTHKMTLPDFQNYQLLFKHYKRDQDEFGKRYPELFTIMADAAKDTIDAKILQLSTRIITHKEAQNIKNVPESPYSSPAGCSKQHQGSPSSQ